MARIIVFGASGLLGNSLVPALLNLGHRVLAQSRDKGVEICLDPSDKMAVIEAFVTHRPDIIVNLVAATDVDRCEMEPHLAWKANAMIVKSLVEGMLAYDKRFGTKPHLVHVSTDQVYDGIGPHAEDEVDMINVYGLSKFTGELFAERVCSTVLRTNFYGRSRCKDRLSFSDWLVESLRQEIPIKVFSDIKFSALHIDSLCRIIARCIDLRIVGVFNAGCRDSISKADFAFALARGLSMSTDRIAICKSTDIELKARRPHDMSLQVSKLENAIDMHLPTIYEEIEYTVKEYLND